MDHPVRPSELRQGKRNETQAAWDGGSWRHRLTASDECRDGRRNGRVRGEGEDNKDEGGIGVERD